MEDATPTYRLTETLPHHVHWRTTLNVQSKQKMQISYVNAYLWNLEKRSRWSYLQSPDALVGLPWGLRQ